MNTQIQRIRSFALMITLALFCGTTRIGLADIRPLDSTITRRVEEKLRRDFLLREADVSVKTIAGNVRIEGEVSGLLDKYRVERLSKQVEGVRNVTARLEVRPLYTRDVELTREVIRALNLDPILRGSRPTVTVRNQVATLGGVVTGISEKNRAEQIVRNVRGVLSVRNSLTLEPVALASVRHDRAIQDDVHIGLHRDPELSRMPILVLVERGLVHLTGEVDNQAQRHRAEKLVFEVRGVQHVDNRLVIRPIRVRADEARRLDRDADSRLVHEVNLQLKSDLRIDTSEIEVLAEHGFVFLRGTVPHIHHDRLATKGARAVPGAQWVESQLVVRKKTARPTSKR